MAGIWRKTLVYLGLMEEDDAYDDYAYDEFEEDAYHEEEPRRREEPRRAGRGGRRDLTAARRASEETGRDAVVRAMPTPSPSPRFHLVMPSGDFNSGAKEIGDRFREGYSVIINLQSVDSDLRQRLVDFGSGLAYGLAGSVQPVADKVLLMTPAGVQVSAEERRRLFEERGFFRQA
ncbi:MAG TPA: cell division protein SepF [Actinomycetota bacterium]|nr:cell division protein SepF [Actinomycetota bacterium]